MKTCKKIFLQTILIILYYCTANAQVINWRNDHQGNQIINLNAGGDYGIVGGIGYAYKLDIRQFPVWLSAGLSTPAGKIFFDDYKIQSGGQVRLFDFKKFQLSTDLQVIFRTINTDYIRAHNIGTEISVTGGYYMPRWFIAAGFGFDKAIATHIKHKDTYKQIYPEVKDGWYEVPTAGNFNYGIQTGISFGKNDLYLKAGMFRTQDFKSTPLLPFYAQLGYNFKFNNKQATTTQHNKQNNEWNEDG